MKIIINLALSALAVLISAFVLPGVHVDGFFTALVAAVILSVVNTFIKPLVQLLTLPLTVLTLGLFSLVINALMVMIVSEVVPGFDVDGLLWAFVFSVVLSLVSGVINMLAPDKK